MTQVLAGWTTSEFESAGISRTVYRRGTGPVVIVVHEIPGITPKVEAFANDVVDAGFTVAMPSLVGTPGKEVSNGYLFSSWLCGKPRRSSVGCVHSPGRCTPRSVAAAWVPWACASAAASRSA
jgi:dienelactone hydrolase